MTSTVHEPRAAGFQKPARDHAVERNVVERPLKPEPDVKIKLDYVVRAPTPLGQRPPRSAAKEKD